MILDTAKRNPLYPESMCFDDVREDVRFITYDTDLSSFDDMYGLIKTFTSMPYLHGNAFQATWMAHARGVDRVPLSPAGIMPPDEANTTTFSVKVDRQHIVDFYGWLIKRGDTKSAARLQRIFSEWLPNKAERNPNAPDFAMTADDAKERVEVIHFHAAYFGHGQLCWTALLHEERSWRSGVRQMRVHTIGSPLSRSEMLSTPGIMRYPLGGWERCFCVINTPKNRKQLLDWLLANQHDDGANQLIEKYPDLVKTSIFVRKGKLVAEVGTI